jgi:hypothetical protein
MRGQDAFQRVASGQGVDGDPLAARVDAEESIVVTRVRPEACMSPSRAVGRERPDPDPVDDDLIGRPGIQVAHAHDECAVETPPHMPDEHTRLALRPRVRGPRGEALNHMQRPRRGRRSRKQRHDHPCGASREAPSRRTMEHLHGHLR